MVAADELIRRKGFRCARQVIDENPKDALATSDDRARVQQLLDLSLQAARAGLYRKSRLACLGLLAAEFSCYAEIVLNYEASKNPHFAERLRQRDERYNSDWE